MSATINNHFNLSTFSLQLYDDGVENTRKQLLTVCPGLQDTKPQLMDNLLSMWRGVRDRLFKHYHFAAKAYFMYLRMGTEVCRSLIAPSCVDSTRDLFVDCLSILCLDTTVSSEYVQKIFQEPNQEMTVAKKSFT